MMTAVEVAVIISALGTRPTRLFSALSGAAGVVWVLAAAAPSAMADTSAQAGVLAGAGVAAGGHWGPPTEVATALNTGDGAAVSSLSCASTGNCSGGGYYTDSSGNIQAFVVSEANGTWGPAQEVAAALNTLGVGQVVSVSCGSAGNCVAGGYYSNSTVQAPFVVSEVNGTWGPAKAVAAALNKGGSARILSVSCGSAGNCSAGGYYTDSSRHQQAFAVNEANGTWGNATELAAALNTQANAAITSVSCASAGNCGAGGYYSNNLNGMHGHSYAFVIGEKNGAWGNAKEVAGALNTIGQGQLYSVSCATAGNCSAGGYYTTSSGEQAFAVNETSGTWRPATKVAGATGVGGTAGLYSVSCGSAGNCSGGGFYTPGPGQQAFVVNETNGTWGPAAKVAGALNAGKYAWLYSVSCGSAGNCSAGGIYTNNAVPRQQEAFVVNETNGTWQPATEMAGALNTGGVAGVNSVSCVVGGYCGAGGSYTGSSGQQAFVASKP
jgi:hypothetical protein